MLCYRCSSASSRFLIRGVELSVWVNGLQVAIGLLLLSITAATSLSEERVRGSVDLIITPLATWDIVGSASGWEFSECSAASVLPTCMIGVIAWETDSGPWYAVGMCVYMLCVGAAVTSLGLVLATRFSRLGWAVGATVILYVLVTVGWFF